MKYLAGLLGSGLLVSQAVAQALQPAAATDIVGGVADCMAVTAAGDVGAGLTGRGWQRATASEDGAPVDMPVSIYGRSGTPVLLVDGTNDGHSGCVVMARVAEVSDLPGVQDAVVSQVAGRIVTQDGAERIIIAPGHVVQFATTGTREQPGVRIFVMNSTEGRQ